MPSTSADRARRVGPAGRAIVQIHPTRRCNLRCRHCYSSSGPDVRDTLAADVLVRAIRDAADEGYDVLAVSGGEPFLYDGLVACLTAAKDAGMACTLTTNGLTLTPARLDAVAGLVDGIAVSLDGVPASHDAMRGAGTFDGMRARLGLLRERAVPFGFVFTLTQHNVDELEWVAGFAAEQGAALLQVHPLEIEGAALALDGAAPDPVELAFGRLEGHRLAERHGDLRIQVDAVARPELEATPERFLAGTVANDAPLGRLLSPLVIETSGRVSPLRYGFPAAYALGSLLDAPLSALAARWRAGGHARLVEVCRTAYGELTAPGGPPFANWYDRVARAAR